MTTFDTLSEPLSHRLRDGLERLAMVLRAEQWTAANAVGLTPTQLHILTFLAGRAAGGWRVKDIARHLGVSQPTATDSVAALERKGLVARDLNPTDARAAALAITAAGDSAVKAAGLVMTASEQAIATLTPGQQSDLLIHVMTLIRALQLSGAMPLQRMCVTCRHFRPFAHPGERNPHHCAFVNAAFGSGHFRLDCREHEPADPAAQAATWTAFNDGSAIHQAST